MGSSMFDLQYFTFNLLLLYVCLPWYDPDNWMTVDMMSLFLLFTIHGKARKLFTPSYFLITHSVLLNLPSAVPHKFVMFA